MNAQLLEEIVRFRQMSNLPIVENTPIKRLPIVENTPIKRLINEGRGDGASTLWRLVLGLDDVTPTGISKRQGKLLTIFGKNGTKLAGVNAKAAAEELAQKKLIKDIEDLVTLGKTTDEIIAFIEQKVTKEIMDKINLSINKYIDADVIEALIKDLSDPTNATRISIIKDFTDEVSEKMKSIAGDSPLVKKAALDGLKAEFIASYKRILGFDAASAEGKIVDDLFEKPYKQSVSDLTSKASKTLSTQQSLMRWFRNAPAFIADLFELINLFYLSRKSKLLLIEKEIEELVIAISTGGVSKNAGKLIADRLKVLIKSKGDETGEYIKLYNELITKIKKAIPDDASGKALLARIEEIENLTTKTKVGGVYQTAIEKLKKLQELFEELEVKPTDEGADIWSSFVKKLKELFVFWEPFKKIYKDGAGEIISSYRGWFFRLTTYIVTGTLSTFEEYIQQMAKVRRNYNFLSGKKYVSGWGAASVVDMYLRIWFRANVLLPLIMNFIQGLGGAIFVCGSKWAASKLPDSIGDFFEPSEATYEKWCSSTISNFFRETVGDMTDTFTPFIAIFDKVFGTEFDSKLDSPTLAKVFWEVWDMVIPFNNRIDNIYEFLNYDPKAKTDKAIEEANKEDETNNVVKPYALKYPKEYAKKMEVLRQRKSSLVGQMSDDREYIPNAQGLGEIMTIDTLDNRSLDPIFLYKDNVYSVKAHPRKGITIYSQTDGADYEAVDFFKNQMNESRYKKTNNMITERNKEKFGEDNFKHWKDTFTFKAQDDKNPGQYKEVKIKMEDVMDRINHYRKKYDEDDSFVRAVIDTHEDVVKIMFTKDLANIRESATPRGLALVLRTIKESRGEMEIFSVSRPANGNWFLVKGDYTPNQLANMDLEKKEPRTKETEVNSKSEDDLKKKEESAINVLKRNEKEGIEDLPKKVRDKVREKMGKGWTTEIPPEPLEEYFTKSEINSIFNDKIVIYKLEPTREFFNSLVKFSARIVIKRGFCRTLKSGKNEIELGERQKMTVNHILNKCNTKYESKLGLRNF